MNSSLQSKIETSIATIQKAAKLAQNYTGKPLVVAFSGGKDSQTVYHLAEAAGVDFEAVYSATTIDPPEVVRFIRKHYPMVHFHVPKMSFWQLVEKTRMLPNRNMRYCCSVTCLESSMREFPPMAITISLLSIFDFLTFRG